MTSEQLIARLISLPNARRSAHEYYSAFLEDEDDVLTVGAWCALLERQELLFDQYPLLVPLSKYAAIRTRAFMFLQSRWEHGLARYVATTEPTAASEDGAERMLARARLSTDPQLFVAAKHAQYLATGRDDALHAILQSVQRGTPVSLVMPYAIRAALIRPHDARMVEALLVLLRRAGQLGTLRAVLDALDVAALHPGLRSIFRAQVR